jgi:hypothetical protein
MHAFSLRKPLPNFDVAIHTLELRAASFEVVAFCAAQCA